MKKELGSKLASSVRQAKESKSQDAGATSPKPQAPKISKGRAERPLTALSSNRIWPD